MIKKLRLKFILINMSIVTLLLCIILGLVFYFTSANLEQESLSMMRNIAAQPFRLDTPEERGEDVRLPFFALQLGPDGDLLAKGGGYYDLSDAAFLDSLIDAAFSTPKQFGVLSEYNLRYYRVDMPLSQCLVFADISSERATLNGLVKTCCIIGVVGFLLFLWVSILLSKWAVRPVEQAWKQQRQFVAAASHELKTPLTVIMTNTELLQNPTYDAGKRETFLHSIQTMSEQMKRLIGQMLELARTDNAEAKEVFAEVDLSRLTTQTVLPFESVFFEKGMRLETDVQENIRVTGAEAQLRELVEILLDNAQKYAREKGCTWVALQKRGRNRCVLTVSDEGEEIPPDALQNLFKRFYRADPARSRSGSFGLGLSIAENIVTQHRGKIWAESKDGINRFTVELPCL
ncbi:HAMP domain-containing sensor histidine kinase [uncultured Agathobaculum sp.]|uniref:sensor histidine kinase n=1 Tax=uncultured Agathobaculum sp. TaxID=2048140 RepID=UPI003209BD32